MTTVSANKAGMALGAVLGGWHTIWALLVAVGWAQAIINFVFWMHMIKPVYVIGAFSAWTALVLIAVTASIGYLAGFVLAALWNRLHREPRHVGALKPAAR